MGRDALRAFPDMALAVAKGESTDLVVRAAKESGNPHSGSLPI